MNLLLTGCAGFIGARVSQSLLDRGDRVIGLDNLNDYYDVRLKLHRLRALETNEGFVFYNADVEDRVSLEKIFSEYSFDAVINLAARAGVRSSVENPGIYLSTNALGTLNLLELMVAHGVPRLVVASTSSLYAGCAMPFVESSNVTMPISPYAATKLASEALAQTWHHLYGINVAILRYFTVYGPAGRPDMSPFRFVEWMRRDRTLLVYGTGSQTRDFTYIDDIAAGTLAALEVRGCEVINLGGGGTALSVNEVIALIESGMDRKASVERLAENAADMHDTSADISKAGRVLKWKPLVTPLEGFRLTVDWHIENAAWLDDLVV
jgi:UDP-glucuronate 4-epimerase